MCHGHGHHARLDLSLLENLDQQLRNGYIAGGANYFIIASGAWLPGGGYQPCHCPTDGWRWRPGRRDTGVERGILLFYHFWLDLSFEQSCSALTKRPKNCNNKREIT